MVASISLFLPIAQIVSKTSSYPENILLGKICMFQPIRGQQLKELGHRLKGEKQEKTCP